MFAPPAATRFTAPRPSSIPALVGRVSANRSAEKRKELSRKRALLVGISGIDASGKGFVAEEVAHSLGKAAGVSDPGYNVALIGVDGWLNLPDVRFDRENPAEHFYERAFRFEE